MSFFCSKVFRLMATLHIINNPSCHSFFSAEQHLLPASILLCSGRLSFRELSFLGVDSLISFLLLVLFFCIFCRSLKVAYSTYFGQPIYRPNLLLPSSFLRYDKEGVEKSRSKFGVETKENEPKQNVKKQGHAPTRAVYGTRPCKKWPCADIRRSNMTTLCPCYNTRAVLQYTSRVA